jgi:hypothetical protein
MSNTKVKMVRFKNLNTGLIFETTEGEFNTIYTRDYVNLIEKLEVFEHDPTLPIYVSDAQIEQTNAELKSITEKDAEIEALKAKLAEAESKLTGDQKLTAEEELEAELKKEAEAVKAAEEQSKKSK